MPRMLEAIISSSSPTHLLDFLYPLVDLLILSACKTLEMQNIGWMGDSAEFPRMEMGFLLSHCLFFCRCSEDAQKLYYIIPCDIHSKSPAIKKIVTPTLIYPMYVKYASVAER